jgi:outer membrane lipoprotein-sorting protein
VLCEQLLLPAARALLAVGVACETATDVTSESELGQLLQLLYGAHGRFRTARGALYHRESRRLVREAMKREVKRGNARPGIGVRIAQGVPHGDCQEPPDLHEERHRFWWEPPDRLRQEVNYDVPEAQRIAVHDGELWWLYSTVHGAVSNAALDAEERAHHQAGGGERFKQLLEPSDFLVSLEFGEISREERVLRVRARPRRDARDGMVRMRFRGADALELEVDAEVGIVRRLTILLDGKELSSTELTELVLDEMFPEDTFVFVPPPGEEVLPPETAQQRRQYTLEEAAAEAPFTVFYVPELPEGNWRMQVHYLPAQRRPPGEAGLGLIYSRADGRGALALIERAAADARPGVAWTGSPPETNEVERDGVRYLIAHGNPKRGRENKIVFEREGTGLELQSELEVEALLGLAASLQPVHDPPGSP